MSTKGTPSRRSKRGRAVGSPEEEQEAVATTRKFWFVCLFV